MGEPNRPAGSLSLSRPPASPAQATDGVQMPGTANVGRVQAPGGAGRANDAAAGLPPAR